MTKNATRSVENAVLKAFNGSVPKGLVLRKDNCAQYISREFRDSMKIMGIRLEYIQNHTQEDNGDIESFHNGIKIDYIWPNEFLKYRGASSVIEKAFTDHNEFKSHLSIGFHPSRELRRISLNYASFRERFEVKEAEVALYEN